MIDLISDINTNLPTTGAGFISASLLRGVLNDIVGNHYKIVNVLGLSFGVKGDGVTDDTNALNAAFAFGANNNVGIYMPAGRYKITSTLYATPQGSNQKSCHIIGAGRGFSSSQSQTIIDATSLTNVPAMVIQRGYGCYLGHFLILGGNVAPVAFYSSVEQMLYGAAWVTPGLRDSRYSPHCGISIDGGVGSTPPDGGYPGFTYLGSAAGSSDIVLDNIAIWDFVVGIMNNSEVDTLQGDDIRIINPQILFCKVPIAFGQGQSDSNTLWGGNLGFCRTCVDMLEYGQQQGHPPTLFDVQYGPAFECFCFGGSFGMQSLIGGRAESVHRMGQVGVGASSSSYPLLLDGFDCHVLHSPQGRCPVVLEAPSHPVEWIGGGLFDDNINGASSFALIGVPLTMRGTLIQMANRFRPFIGGAIDFQYPVELRNCRVFDTGGAIIYGNESRLFSFSGRFSAHWSEGKIRDRNNLYQYQAGAVDNYINIGTTSAIVFTSTTLTFNNNDPGGLAVGDLIMWRFNTIGKSLIQYIAPAAQITSIIGNAVTCSLLYPLSYYDQTYNSGNTTSVVVNEWATAPGQSLVGNVTNGSPTLGNVTPTNILQNGDWITGLGIPNNTRVSSGGGTATITLSRNGNANTTGAKLGFGGLKYMDGDLVSADHGDASAILYPRQDVPVQLWGTTLTGNRTITIGEATAGSKNGDRFLIVRSAIGSFTLTVNTIDSLSLAASQWAEIRFDINVDAWRTVAKGSLT